MTEGTDSTPETESAPTLRDALSAAFDAAESPAPEVEAQSTPTSEDVTESNVEDTAGSEQSAATEATESPDETIQKPQHWSDEDWNALKDLPKSAVDIVLKKEKEFQGGFTRKSEEIAEQRKRFDSFDRMLGELHRKYAHESPRQRFEQVAIDSIPAVMDIYATYQRDPLGTLVKLAEGAGITDKLMESLAGLDTSEEARKLRQKEAELNAREAQQRSYVETTQRQSAEQVISQFKDAKDANGTLKYPHFSDVEGNMARLIAADPSLTLEAAYNEAIWANPSTRDKLLEVERKAEAAKLEEARRQKAKEVRKTVRPGNGRAGSPDPKGKPRTLREQLSQNWDDLQAQA